MAFIYTLKLVGFLATAAVVWLMESGDCLVALAALPMLFLMWYATRQRAQRRAQESGSE